MCWLRVQNLPSEFVFDGAWVAFEEPCCLSFGWKFALLSIIDWGKWKVLLFLSRFTSPNISQLVIGEFIRILLHQALYMVVQRIKFNEVLARGMSLHEFTVGVIKSFGYPSLWALAYASGSPTPCDILAAISLLMLCWPQGTKSLWNF